MQQCSAARAASHQNPITATRVQQREALLLSKHREPGFSERSSVFRGNLERSGILPMQAKRVRFLLSIELSVPIPTTTLASPEYVPRCAHCTSNLPTTKTSRCCTVQHDSFVLEICKALRLELRTCNMNTKHIQICDPEALIRSESIPVIRYGTPCEIQRCDIESTKFTKRGEIKLSSFLEHCNHGLGHVLR